jgi:hypothetical protein
VVPNSVPFLNKISHTTDDVAWFQTSFHSNIISANPLTGHFTRSARMAFIFNARKVHLTYKTHIDETACKDLMKSYGDIKIWSFVHENGDESEEDPTPYEHTHVFVWWQEKRKLNGARVFDVGEIHPHVNTKKSIQWARTICLVYHLGHKTKADGKKYYIKPIFLSQEGVDDWKFEAQLWEAARKAPTLEDACAFVGAKAKSINDVKTIRAEGRKRTFDKVEEDCTKEWIPIGVEWDRKKTSLVIIGDSMAGKTNWAKAQFERPFEITQLEDLKDIPEGCDGLVWDDMDCTKYCMQNQKMITDCRKATSIWSRNKNSRKPHLPQIFTANGLPFDVVSDDAAVGNRITVWRKTGKFYVE